METEHAHVFNTDGGEIFCPNSFSGDSIIIENVYPKSSPMKMSIGKSIKTFINTALFKSGKSKKGHSIAKMSLKMQLLKNEISTLKDLIDFADEKILEAGKILISI